MLCSCVYHSLCPSSSLPIKAQQEPSTVLCIFEATWPATGWFGTCPTPSPHPPFVPACTNA